MSKIYIFMSPERRNVVEPITTLNDRNTALNWFQETMNKTLSFTPFKEGDEPAYLMTEGDLSIGAQWQEVIEIYEVTEDQN